MSVPPPPQNPWGRQPGVPDPGQRMQGQPYGPPSEQQQRWCPPPEPPKRSSGLKWAFLAVTLIAVIAVVAAVILYFTRGGSGNNSSTASSATSGIASANDKGPVSIITEDPSCAAWTPVQNTLAASQKNGWDSRDASIPATAWTPEQRSQYEAVRQAMLAAADNTVPLARLTPHRVMRELYEQFIAYARVYADHIPNYTAPDDHFALVVNSLMGTLGGICPAISYGSAAARAPLVQPAATPSQVAPPSDAAAPQRFLTSPNLVCSDWKAALDKTDADTTAWQGISGDIPASQLTPEEKKVNENAAPVLSALADKIEQLGQRSGNPVLDDFAAVSGQYRRAYVQSLPTYIPNDGWLLQAANYGGTTVKEACMAVGG
jgi:hypothetical protein